MLIAALIAIAVLLLWIGASANSIIANTGIAAAEAAHLRGAAAELIERVDAIEGHLDRLTDATRRLDDLITVGAYSLSQRPEFIDLEPNYFAEKDLTPEARGLRSAARSALRGLARD